MARDGNQQHKRPQRSSETEEAEAPEVEASEDVAERKEKLDDDIDSILDEIDDVLESNAEEFVKGFVQKGGE
ncbi:MAG TPA: ubiquitin-like protein Pup [Nocardioidaceae bacterium]|nr:ubiquitin-like protein Pup [Nocardioidaceae bacterium]